MRRVMMILIFVAALALFLIGFMLWQRPENTGYDKTLFEKYENYTLRQLADQLGIKIGTCVSYSNLKSDQKYIEILAREFNVITPENELKFDAVHPAPKYYSFQRSDEIVNFAEKNNMKIRGHTLVWHNQNPAWIIRGQYTKEEWMDILKNHIETVVGRYRGRIYAWDVVNEAFNDDGSLRNSVWYNGIGPEYIELAFRWAHEADPDALLFYNDYGIEDINAKSNAVYELVKNLLNKGVPIHGIGMQMHIGIERYPTPDKLARNIRRFEELGLIVEITEMDVSIELPADAEEFEKQAQVYKNVLKTYLESQKPSTFVMWGFVDKYSWILYTFPGRGAPLIFDNNYEPKPAYYALIEALIEKMMSK
ncbi:MAG: endo-1,4-beta-xylanase [Thermoproteota archaeon]